MSEVETILLVIWGAFCSFLVLFMCAGLFLRELGLVGAKNTVNTAIKLLAILGLGSLGYWLLGSGIMFGTKAAVWADSSQALPAPIGALNSINLLYQLICSVVPAIIVSGAIAERARFLPFVVAAFVISSFIYPIFGAWVWGGEGDNLGWLQSLGFHDAAGGTVIHSIAGWCALGAVIVVGSRNGRYSRKGVAHNIPGHNIPLLALGGLVLWCTWFGLAGRAVSHDFSNLGGILLNTHLGAIGGVCGTTAYLSFIGKSLSITRLINGSIAGLVAITAGCDVFNPQAALLVATLAGVIVCRATALLERFNIDDIVAAVSVHGFAGAWGTIAVGLFYQGDMFSLERIIAQLVGVIVAFAWGVSTSYLLFFTLNRIAPVRVTERVEERGLDIGEHNEIAYSDFMVTRTRTDS